MLTISIIKRRLREIDRRVRYLTKCMENTQKSSITPRSRKAKYFFGAWVEIENDDGVDLTVSVLSATIEIFGRKDYISIDSPMARALLKKESAIWRW